MDDKKYLDKVLDYIISRTKIDYDNNLISTPFFLPPPSSFSFFISFFSSLSIHSSLYFPSFFSDYCKRFYGLTEDEIEYVWEEYKKIILDKINQ